MDQLELEVLSLINKNLRIQTARNDTQNNTNKNKIVKYYDRATRLSPRSWIKQKNFKEKEKGLEFIASRLSLVSSTHRLQKEK